MFFFSRFHPFSVLLSTMPYEIVSPEYIVDYYLLDSKKTIREIARCGDIMPEQVVSEAWWRLMVSICIAIP
jgi:hypothetical protein